MKEGMSTLIKGIDVEHKHLQINVEYEICQNCKSECCYAYFSRLRNN